MTEQTAARPASAPAPARSVALGALVIVGIVGWLGLLWIGATLYAATPPKAGFDLELLLGAGRDVAAGRSPYDPALVAGTAPVAESLFYSYPPVVAQLMAAFAALPSPVMLVAWDAAAVVGLAAVAVALARRFAPDLPSRSVALPVVALAPLCFPFAIGLLFGNLDVFFPLLYGAMLLAVAPGTTPAVQGAGGVALATAAIAKLHPATLGVWFGVRGLGGDRPSGRVFLVALGIGLAVLVASVLIGGVSAWSDYVAVVRAGSSADLVDPRNAGPAAQLALLLGAGGRVRPDGADRRQPGCPRRDPAGRASRRRSGRATRLGRRRLARDAAGHLVPLPVGDDPVRDRGPVPRPGHAGRRPRSGCSSRRPCVVAAVAIAFLPLIWVAIGLVLGREPRDASRRGTTEPGLSGQSPAIGGMTDSPTTADAVNHVDLGCRSAGRGGRATNRGRVMHHWLLAYIDPGAGSLIVQATIAAMLTIPYFLRRQIARAVRGLSRFVARSDRSERPADRAG